MSPPGVRIYFDEPPREDNVSLAVVPVDAFSGRTVDVGVKASIEGLYNRPIKNLSGHLVFMNLPTQPQYRVIVDATDAKYFAPEPFVFVPPTSSDAKAKRKPVKLVPRPGFPFAEATLIRGVLQRGTGQNATPVKGARIWVHAFISGEPFETLSDERGAFALPISLPPSDHPNAPEHPVTVTVYFEQAGDARHLDCQITEGKSHSFAHPINLIGPDSIDDAKFFSPDPL